MTYSPPIKDASELQLVRQEKPDAPDLVRCFEQAAPARRLPHLSGIPILILTSEAFGEKAGLKFHQGAGFVTFFVAIICVMALGRWLREEHAASLQEEQPA